MVCHLNALSIKIRTRSPGRSQGKTICKVVNGIGTQIQPTKWLNVAQVFFLAMVVMIVLFIALATSLGVRMLLLGIFLVAVFVAV